MALPRMRPVAALTTALAATAVCAGGHGGNPAVTARQAHMQLYVHTLGILGGMARGKIEYDAAAASAAASNIATLATLSQASYWAPGTDSDSLPGGSNALPAFWENFADAAAKAERLAVASASLAATAGDGLDALRAGLGPVGQVCGACHEAYQRPEG